MPVYGCVLIGGKSARMGRPKHLLQDNGRTWLERTAELLERSCQTIVVAGTGDVPETLTQCVRLPDVAGAEGPMAGLLSAMRWAPHASWLVAACDLPDLTAEALDWLLAVRRPGVWATLPKLADSSNVEPLLAHYDSRARSLLERTAAGGTFGLHRITSHAKVNSPVIPTDLAAAWRNVNSPEDLAPGTRGPAT
jgi:molybdopterin-guanine dinucleotide biosynthesis protein A